MSHTPKKFQSIHIYFTKVKKPPDGLCIHLLFASAIILIFSGIILHSLSRILKVNIKLLRVPTTEFSRQKCITRRDNPNSSKRSWKAKNNPPKGHIKNRPFVFCKIPKDGICHMLSSRVKYSENKLF